MFSMGVKVTAICAAKEQEAATFHSTVDWRVTNLFIFIYKNHFLLIPSFLIIILHAFLTQRGCRKEKEEGPENEDLDGDFPISY